MSIYSEDRWMAGMATLGDVTLIVRARATLPAAAHRVRFRHLFLVAWQFADPAAAMPSAEENDLALDFEAALDEVFADSEDGVLAAVVTGDGKKEWRFYAHDTDRFMAAFNRALAGHPRYPLQIANYFDDDWRGLSELLGTKRDGPS